MKKSLRDRYFARRILVRSPNWLGDAVMAVAAMKDLSEYYKPETFCVICKKGLGDLFRRYAFIDEAVEFASGESGRVHKELRGRKFDAVFLFTNSFRSAWDARKTGARNVIGFSGDFRGFLLSHALKKPRNVHMADYYMSLAAFMADSPPNREAGFPLISDEEEFAQKIKKAEGAIGLPLGARYGSAKCWPSENISAFIKMVLEKTERNIILFGTDSERPLAEELASDDPSRITSLAGQTSIGQMAAVMKRCHTVVANDSGPLHVAAALGVKTVALFGSTDPRYTSPLTENVTVIKRDAECAPCFKRECPTDFHCMKDITPEEVFLKLG